MLTGREYRTDLPFKSKMGLSFFLYGFPIFFLKKKVKLRGVVDSQDLNRIMEGNNTSFPRTDKIFDRLRRARFVPKSEKY